MIRVARACIRHRRLVIVIWLVIAVGTTLLAGAAGRDFSTDFSLPGTQSQRVLDLLKSHFPAQSGDVDTVVFHYAHGSIDSPAIKPQIQSLVGELAKDPHVVHVLSPYEPGGALQVSKDRHTAFITVNYSQPANKLANATGKPVLNQISRIHVRGLSLAAGGQVIEQAENFSLGPATVVGVIAAILILLLTFGSMITAGLPLVTAGIGLITGIGLIGLATHVFSVDNVAPDLALMIGLGVGIDYALFIVTRFRESYSRLGDVEAATVEAMDTSGRAVLLAGATVVIALLGMFATGVNFMYGLSIGSVLAVLMVLLTSLTVLPALLSKFGHRVVRPSRRARRREQKLGTPPESAWRRWSVTVQARPKTLAAVSLGIMILCVVPFFSLRLQSSDAGNDPAGTSTHNAYSLLSKGFGAGFNGPLLVAVQMPNSSKQSALPEIRKALLDSSNVAAVTAPRISPSGTVAVLEVYPGSDPQSVATTNLVKHLRNTTLPPLEHQLGVSAAIGGFTATSIDFSHVLATKLPLFIGIVVILSALLLFVIFRSVVIPLQAAVMNLLSIGGAIGATVAVFQWGWLSSIFGVSPAPIEPWIPVIMFAVVFGLSMDYEVFLVSRIREEWVHKGDASQAVADGIAFTGRVITAAAAIMICVFLSFMLGDERPIKEFGFGLAAAVLLDALVIRCVMLPAVLELLGKSTWWLPAWLERTLPEINIEGSSPATHEAERDRRVIAEPVSVSD